MTIIRILKQEELNESRVIKDYYLGATHIIIRDDSCCDPKDVEGIIKQMGEQASRAFLADALKKEETA
ncbi:MAG: hypothetical protein K0R31_1865 [Clostridiales bacterium]|nr:hypothetical protein [Clostridiales bacterium]